jgi:hypothetical protein
MSCWRRMAFLLDSMRHSLADSRAVVSAKSLDTVNFSLRGRRRPSAGLCGWPRRCPPELCAQWAIASSRRPLVFGPQKPTMAKTRTMAVAMKTKTPVTP